LPGLGRSSAAIFTGFDNLAMTDLPALRWDIFCRVVDNFGDAGVCWRLAADLAARGDTVRLVIDDAAPLAFMAPHGAPGVQVLAWPGPMNPADVVVEAFGCDPPEAYVAEMALTAARTHAPVWINLEYLSAEPYVARCHGLPSPQPNGLTKWFYYPGFTPATGGLLREHHLGTSPARLHCGAWPACQGIQAEPGERVVSLFCYDNPQLPALLQALADTPTLLLLTPGPAQRQVAEAPPAVRLVRLPWLTQTEFDALLQACDINFVRGEDSLVRALWAGKPFVWQAYPQDDGAHHAKLSAMLGEAALPDAAAVLWRAWNGVPGAPKPALPQGLALQDWQRAALDWRARLWRQDDLSTQLRRFANGKSLPCG
jgi:uncharacterized repeat protein (TIGR03837 family)